MTNAGALCTPDLSKASDAVWGAGFASICISTAVLHVGLCVWVARETRLHLSKCGRWKLAVINCVRDEHRVWLHRRYSQDGVNDALGTESRGVSGCRNGQAATARCFWGSWGESTQTDRMAGGLGRHGGVCRAAAHHFVLGAYLQSEKENMLCGKKNKSYGKLKKNIRKMLAPCFFQVGDFPPGHYHAELHPSWVKFPYCCKTEK